MSGYELSWYELSQNEMSRYEMSIPRWTIPQKTIPQRTIQFFSDNCLLNLDEIKGDLIQTLIFSAQGFSKLSIMFYDQIFITKNKYGAFI